jgi:hypothetical protein
MSMAGARIIKYLGASCCNRAMQQQDEAVRVLLRVKTQPAKKM